MIDRALHRLILLRKCQGAAALPLDELAARAHGAAAKVVGGYHIYLQRLLQDIDAAARRPLASWSPDAWHAFMRAVHDVKSSAAMAGETFVFDYACLLEMVLWRADRCDPHLDAVIRLFLTALDVAADRSFDDAELGNLQESLRRVSGWLGGAARDSTKARHS